MDRISRRGPLGAVAAARQLAPDNGLFRTAAALATTRIPMARALAIDALTGGEALKVSDTLFNDQIAKTYFSREIVPALRLMSPEMRKRSEEHTSELQSLMRISYAVFCLKQKKQKEQ